MADTREDLQRTAYEERMAALTPDPCLCGGRWECIGRDPAYGADADGRRGIMLREWKCECGRTVSLMYG